MASNRKADGDRRSRAIYSIESDNATEVVVLDKVDPVLPRCQLGVQFLDSGGAQVTPSAGTVAFAFQTEVNGLWETFDVVPDLDATQPKTSTFWAGVIAVRATPTGLAGCDHFRLVLSTTIAA